MDWSKETGASPNITDRGGGGSCVCCILWQHLAHDETSAALKKGDSRLLSWEYRYLEENGSISSCDKKGLVYPSGEGRWSHFRYLPLFGS